jgi:hypothetical protein
MSYPSRVNSTGGTVVGTARDIAELPTPVSTVKRVAGINLLAYRLVTTDSAGQLIYYDAADVNQCNKCIGIIEQATAAGNTARVITTGSVTNTNWNFTSKDLLFAGLDGLVTTDPFVGKFSQIVGYVLSPDTIVIQPQLGIRRAI